MMMRVLLRAVPVWATLQDLEEVNERMVKIKADLMSELVAVSILHACLFA